MRNSQLRLFAILTLTALTLFSGCSSKSKDTVAQVGDYDISLEFFENYIRGVPRDYASAQAEFDVKRGYLDSLINIRLLVAAGYEKGLNKLPAIEQLAIDNKNRFLLDLLYHNEVASKIDVPEAEIRQLWDEMKYQIRARHILLPTEDSALAVLEMLKNGADFERLAYDLSIDPSAKVNRGDLGYFIRGSMVEEFEKAAFVMEAGEISPPVKSRFGYHIINVVDKKINETRRPFEQMRTELKARLVNKKSTDLQDDFLARMDAKYPITLDTSVADYVLFRRRNLYPPSVLDQLPKNDFDIEQLDRDERELVLAKWDGGQMSLLSYILQSRQRIPAQTRPDFDDYDSLLAIVQFLARTDILAIEASRQGLEETDEYKDKMKLFREFAMADIMRYDSIPSPPDPTEEEIRAYYDEHLSEFETPRKVHIFEILVSDEHLARKLAREIKTLDVFKAKAVELTERPDARIKRGDMGYVDKYTYGAGFWTAWKTPNGVIGGPIRFNDKFSIFWPVDRRPKGYKPYLAVKSNINDQLIKTRRQEAVAAWMADRREKTSIEVNEDLIWAGVDRGAYAAVPLDTTGTP